MMREGVKGGALLAEGIGEIIFLTINPGHLLYE
jgi:hypothetical protein